MQGWEDILFENRNKSYGAYDLRKKSGKYLLAGLLLSISFMFIGSVVLFVILNSDLFFASGMSKTLGVESIEITDLRDILVLKLPPPAQEKAPPDLASPEITDSTTQEKKKIENQNSEALKTAKDSTTAKGVDDSSEEEGTPIKGDTLIYLYGRNAQFIGGKEALDQFIRKNLNVKLAPKNKGKLSIVVQFYISRIGDVHDVSLISSGNIEPALKTEIIRVFSMLPRWIPASDNGRPKEQKCACSLNL